MQPCHSPRMSHDPSGDAPATPGMRARIRIATEATSNNLFVIVFTPFLQLGLTRA